MDIAGVHTTVNYLVNRPGPGEPLLTSFTEEPSRSTLQLRAAPVFVTDARQAVANGATFGLDTEGFGLFDHPSGVVDFDQFEEDPELDRRYVDEVVARLAEITGADLVVSISSPKKRFGEGASDQLEGLHNAKPARHVHVDYTDAASAEAAARACPDHRDRFGRYALFNVWRATSRPPQDIPLAVCAANSVAPHDELEAISVTRHRKLGDVDAPIVAYEANDAHRWYFYRDMEPDEILVFKAFDSDPNRACRVPHTAFSDPGCPPDTPTRSSVELRLVAFFA